MAEIRAGMARVFRPSSAGIDLGRLVPHLTATALRDVGVLHYEAALGAGDFDVRCRYFVQLNRVTAAATARLDREAADRGRRVGVTWD